MRWLSACGRYALRFGLCAFGTYALLAARYVLGRLTCAHTQAVDFTRFTLTRSLYCKWYLCPALEKIPPDMPRYDRRYRYDQRSSNSGN